MFQKANDAVTGLNSYRIIDAQNFCDYIFYMDFKTSKLAYYCCFFCVVSYPPNGEMAKVYRI